ncbi:MAG: hypothetical protein AB199_00300 [Parcubacteria bacterium C7867-004]|nr:MAG: hypothetical protein AB199_00300 [Parcubacteria bacterium C7867-004]
MESNHHFNFRKVMSYPLNDKSVTGLYRFRALIATEATAEAVR